MDFGTKYYFTEYKTFNKFLKQFIKVIKNKKIIGLYSNDGLFFNENKKFTDRIYTTDDINYILFDDGTILKFEYNFFSMMYISYTKKSYLYEKELEIFKLDNLELVLDCKGACIVDYELESFNDEYIINPSDDTIRPQGGDYFKEIVFHLDNNKKLCICAENGEFDGECDIWLEENRLKEIFNGQVHHTWWYDEDEKKDNK